MTRDRFAYHSALSPEYEGLEPLDWFELDGCSAYAHDMTEGVPSVFTASDVTLIYAEPPWRHGAVRFYERIGKPPTEWNRLADSMVALVEAGRAHNIPVMMTAGRGRPWSFLPAADAVADTVISGAPGKLYAWGTTIPVDSMTHRERLNFVIDKAGRKMANAYCGYGYYPLRAYAERGTRFIASDINPKCIAYIHKRMIELTTGSPHA